MNVTFRHRYSIPQDQHGISRLESDGPSLAWAIGVGQLLRTGDGGVTWTNSFFSSPLHLGLNPERVAFLSAQEGLLLAEKVPGEVVFYRTEDGGRSWSQIRRLEGCYVWTELFALSSSRKVWWLAKRKDKRAFVEIIDHDDRTWVRVPLTIRGAPKQILFANLSKGWILERWNQNSWIEGSPSVAHTTTVLHETRDGGNTWEIVCKKECAGVMLRVVGGAKLLMAAEEGIFLSQDDGRNWVQSLGSLRVPLYDMHFSGPVGMAVGTEGHIESQKDVLIMISSDSGKNWSEIPAPGIEAFLGVRMTTWSAGILASDRTIYTFEIT